MHFNGKLSWLGLLRQSKKEGRLSRKREVGHLLYILVKEKGQPSILFIRYSETVGNNLLQNKIQDTNRSTRQRI